MENIEQEIQERASVAPRITPRDIEQAIVGEHYFTAFNGRVGAIAGENYAGVEHPAEDDADLVPLKLLTFCVLRLRNGYTVTGESACVSAENFDAEIGRKVARNNAVGKMWPLLGYALAEKLRG